MTLSNHSPACIGQQNTITSALAYLIGVPKTRWEDRFAQDVCASLTNHLPARIIRSLCIIRNAVLQYPDQAERLCRKKLHNWDAVPGCLCPDVLAWLDEAGIPLIRYGMTAADLLCAVNRHILARIDACQDVFLTRISWEHIRSLMIDPLDAEKDGAKRLLKAYRNDPGMYPHRCYLHLPEESQGRRPNLLDSDAALLMYLHRAHPEPTPQAFLQFLRTARRASIIIDGENTNPFDFASFLCAMESQFPDAMSKVQRVCLLTDPCAPSAWSHLARHTRLPIDQVTVRRLNPHKSLVDAALITSACAAVYDQHADSLIVVSSDSDFWGMIHFLPAVRFCLLANRAKTSQRLEEACVQQGVPILYLPQADVRESPLLLDVIAAGLDRCATFLRLDEITQQVLSPWASPPEQLRQAVQTIITDRLAVRFNDAGRGRLAIMGQE